MMFSANWRLSLPGNVIPTRWGSFPGCFTTWAESTAASPRTTTLPLPAFKARPWARLAAETRFSPLDRYESSAQPGEDALDLLALLGL